jgi:hypothetical protein
VVTGTNNAVRDLIPPVAEKLYTITNNTTGGFAIRVIGSSGNGVNIPNGITALVYCDGTNFNPGLSGTSGSFSVNGPLSTTGALTYGGVTLSNSVTGTGSMALSASPTFTGTPAAPTASPGTNTTQLATTAFVTAALQAAYPVGSISLIENFTMCPFVAEPKSLGYCKDPNLYLLSNKAPKGPFVVVPGIVIPPIEDGMEMMAIDFSF